MRTFLLIVCVLITTVLAAGGNPNGAGVGADCLKDIGCFDYCCNNDKNYTITGICVPYTENSRCYGRKKLFLFMLYFSIAVFLAGVVWCLFGLRWDSTKKEKYLLKIKED